MGQFPTRTLWRTKTKRGRTERGRRKSAGDRWFFLETERRPVPRQGQRNAASRSHGNRGYSVKSLPFLVSATTWEFDTWTHNPNNKASGEGQDGKYGTLHQNGRPLTRFKLVAHRSRVVAPINSGLKRDQKRHRIYLASAPENFSAQAPCS